MSAATTPEEDLKALRQHAHALKEEWERLQVLTDVQSLETDFFEETTSNELGVVSAVGLGVGLGTQMLKALLVPKVATPLVTGCWLLGGCYCLFRLTAGTVSSWYNTVERNARRKRILKQKLETIEDRIKILASLADILDPATTAAAEGKGMQTPPRTSISDEAATKGLHHQSPTGSSSSAELVELPNTEETGAVSGSTSTGGGGALESLRRYAQLGGSKKKDA